MQQRQLRLGDILDDYCPRERRVTNHAVVAMVGDAVKQTRCTTCDAEHEYKHAKVPRQRRKSDAPAALYAQVAANAPKRVTHDPQPSADAGVSANESFDDDAVIEEAHERDERDEGDEQEGEAAAAPDDVSAAPVAQDEDDEGAGDEDVQDEGPVHRPLIRASLPRPEGQQPPARPIPEFTIRQPGGRPNRFRPRHARGGQPQQGHQFHGNRSNGNLGGPMRGPRPNGGRPGGMKRHGAGGGRKRSK